MNNLNHYCRFKTIVVILNQGKEYLKQVKRLIISSNNKFPLIRKKISMMGFILNDEKIIYEEGKYYIIMEFIKGDKKYTEEELFFGPILLNNKDDMFYKYFNYLRDVDKKILKDIPEDNNKREEMLKELEMLDKNLI